jgi:hypothetical protein
VLTQCGVLSGVLCVGVVCVFVRVCVVCVFVCAVCVCLCSVLCMCVCVCSLCMMGISWARVSCTMMVGVLVCE